MFNMLGAIAQFERELMLERQREGVARPRRTGSTKAGPLQHVPKHPRCYGCIVKGSDQLRLPSGSVSGAHLCIAS